ncbi:MAG: methionine adenosyltransferase, partial [Halanaeroarchaeum sp.]
MTERNIRVQALDRGAVEDQEVEIVERKGIGHPDSICDGIAEAVSRALAQEYVDRFGKVLHYNTDETQLVAGDAAPAFGGGEVIEPIYILLVGRATKHYDGTDIPVDAIALEAARSYLRETIPNLDLESDVIVDVKLGEGSGDLQEVFSEPGAPVPMANDTSFGVGHAPLTETERIVLETERRLDEEFGESHPALGEDVKVMGKREGDTIDLTVAAAMVDAYVPNMDAYRAEVEAVREFVSDLAYEYTDREVRVHVNTADDYDEGSI